MKLSFQYIAQIEAMPVRAEQVAKAAQRDIFLSQLYILLYSQDGHQKWMMYFCQFGIIELNCQLKQVICCWVYQW